MSKTGGIFANRDVKINSIATRLEPTVDAVTRWHTKRELLMLAVSRTSTPEEAVAAADVYMEWMNK